MKDYKELLILRHGKSDWNLDCIDFNRPLSPRGQHDAQTIGNWLKQEQQQPDLIISSPALRALTTAEITCLAMDLPVQSIQTDINIYEASLSDLLQLLTTLPDSVQRLLLVGHNPGLEQLLSHLVPHIPMPDNYNLMPTAALAYMQMNKHWSALQGRYLTHRVNDLV